MVTNLNGYKFIYAPSVLAFAFFATNPQAIIPPSAMQRLAALIHAPKQNAEDS
jgi:hypothetical protein